MKKPLLLAIITAFLLITTQAHAQKTDSASISKSQHHIENNLKDVKKIQNKIDKKQKHIDKQQRRIERQQAKKERKMKRIEKSQQNINKESAKEDTTK